MSPSIDGPGSGASGRPPGSSSSIGKLITCVGPGRSIHRMCRSAIAAVSSHNMDSSAAGFTSIRAMTNLATLTSSVSETSTPDSLDTSMVMRRSPSRTAGRGSALRPVHRRWFLGSGVGVDDFGHQPMAHHVGAGEFGEVDVADFAKYVLGGPKARRRAAWQIDLSDVTGDDHLRAKSQAGQEHLHLFSGGVLRLVENDERGIKRAAPHVCQWCNLNDPGAHQLWDELGIHHIVQRVVQRPQIRVDL